MSLECLLMYASRRVPEPYCLIVGGRRYRLAIRREDDYINLIAISLERLLIYAGRRVPEPYCLIS
jgi:hypothetical protein